MNHYFFYIFCLIYTSLSFGQSVKLRGTIKNPVAQTLSLNALDDRPIAESNLRNGKFALRTTLKEGYYFLRHGNEVTDVYIKPGDDLEIRIDGNEYKESILFLGEGAWRNNYLAAKNRLDKKAREDLEVFYKGTLEDFLKRFDTLQAKQVALLENSNTLLTFKIAEKQALEYERLFAISSYPQMLDFYFGKQATLPQNYIDVLDKINYDNERLYNSVPFYRYLASSKWKKDIKNATSLAEMMHIYDGVYSKSIKVDLLYSFYYSISKEPEKARDYFELIEANTTSPAFVNAARERMLTIERISPGKPSPPFNFENYKGGTVSLEDLKGSFVVIDIWATWCAPCIQQIPALKKLEEKYNGKNIKFVSISVDKKEAYDKWRTFVSNKALGGIQLFADNSFQSEFIEAYGISSIPRFIIIDPDGLIHNAYASKPSSHQFEQELERLFK